MDGDQSTECAGGIFAPFVPGNLDELKVKELKNGRLAMLAFAGFVMSAQVLPHPSFLAQDPLSYHMLSSFYGLVF